MKLIFAAVLLLILSGCTQTGAPPRAIPEHLTPTKETENDILRCYPLDSPECRFFAVGEDLFLHRGKELLRCTGKNLVVGSKVQLPSVDCTVFTDGKQVGYFDPESQEAVLLCTNQTLRIGGVPVLRDGNIYYRTGDAIMEGSFDTGILRMLRSGVPEDFSVDAVLSDGTLVCGNNLISPADGRAVGNTPTIIAASTGRRDYRALRLGSNDCITAGRNLLPLPPGWRFLAFWEEEHCALICRDEGQPELALFDLNTGNRRAQIILNMTSPSEGAVTADGRVFFRSGDLWLWIPEYNPVRDTRIHFADPKGMTQCRQRALFLEEQYGLHLLLGADAVRQFANMECEPEDIGNLVMDALDRIEKALTRFPAEFIRSVIRSGRNVYLCPVRSIRHADTEPVFLLQQNGADTCLYIAVNTHAGESVIRGLSGIMDGRVFSLTDTYDSWEALNPEGFHYGGDTDFDPAAFTSAADQLSPAADRAGVLIAAVESGNRELFRSAILQNKLRKLCTALREVYPISNRNLPWEQYLWEQGGMG